MNHDTDADPDEGPDAVDRLLGRRKRIRSLPGPRPNSSPAALQAPSPTVVQVEQTPVSEVSVSPEHVYVTVELPGAPKDALDIQTTGIALTVIAPRVGSPACRLELALPCSVDPESAKATYRNGILDITLDRARQPGGDRDEE